MDGKTKLEAALDHARGGFAVFPLIPNNKRPLIENWRNLATVDKSRIRQWWTETPDANIGIQTDRLLVVDIDPRKGGLDSWKTLAEYHDLIGDLVPTARSKTWSGGDHI